MKITDGERIERKKAKRARIGTVLSGCCTATPLAFRNHLFLPCVRITLFTGCVFLFVLVVGLLLSLATPCISLPLYLRATPYPSLCQRGISLLLLIMPTILVSLPQLPRHTLLISFCAKSPSLCYLSASSCAQAIISVFQHTSIRSIDFIHIEVPNSN